MIAPLLAAAMLAASPPDLAAFRWEKRVLLVSAADAGDARLEEQRRILGRWKAGARDRDLAIVEIVADRVAGTGETADALRGRYSLPSAGFGLVLIGKDGGIKLRGTEPLSAAVLERTIDAMPMRRAGRR